VLEIEGSSRSLKTSASQQDRKQAPSGTWKKIYRPVCFSPAGEDESGAVIDLELMGASKDERATKL
jgi:hypothetical protein